MKTGMASCSRAHLRRSRLGEVRRTDKATKTRDLPSQSLASQGPNKERLEMSTLVWANRTANTGITKVPLPLASQGLIDKDVGKCNVFPLIAVFRAFNIDVTFPLGITLSHSRSETVAPPNCQP